MTTLLFVTSSLFGEGSKSRLIGRELVESWLNAHPGSILIERDLTAESMPHLSSVTLAATMTPSAELTDAQRANLAFADELIEETEKADTIVLAVPMYNFSIPSTLKAWIDHITRAGRTFRYGAAGAEGLLKGKKVFIVTGRGGIYSGESPARSMDFQEPYLRAMLGFLGLTDIAFIHVEGLQVSPEAAARGIEQARQAVLATLPVAAAA